MIHGLLGEDTLVIHASCTISSTPKKRVCNALSRYPCILEITVYGPWELCDEIGEWFQEQDVFLQDPRVCHLNVKYCNPQRLSFQGEQPLLSVSQVIAQSSAQIVFHELSERPELLDLLSGQEDLEEAIPSPMICTVLHR
jgi:hypothetical protein